MRRTLVAALFAVAAVAIFGMPVVEPEVVSVNEAVGEQLIVEGVLNRFGNEPHTFLGILVTPDTPPVLGSSEGRVLALDDERVFALEGELASEVNRYQGQRLTIRGVLSEASESALIPPVMQIESYTRESD